VGATGAWSVSELLDQLVTSARQTGVAGPSRSVVGTIDLSPGDPDLEGADEAVRELFARSLAQPIVLRERSPEDAVTRPRKRGVMALVKGEVNEPPSPPREIPARMPAWRGPTVTPPWQRYRR